MTYIQSSSSFQAPVAAFAAMPPWKTTTPSRIIPRRPRSVFLRSQQQPTRFPSSTDQLFSSFSSQLFMTSFDEDDIYSTTTSRLVDMQPSQEQGVLVLPKDETNKEEESTPREESYFNTNSSIAWLNAVAVLWGTQHAVMKQVVTPDDLEAVTMISPALFVFMRFALAAALASPYLVFNTPQNLWRWALELGLYMSCGFGFQAIGLQSTTAQRSGFLLYLNVKFVPFLARILLGRPISLETWISALAAFMGTALLAWDGGGAAAVPWNVGDVWTVAAAVASALFILRLEAASQAIDDSAALNAACLTVVATLAGIWSWADTTTTASILDEAIPLVQNHTWEIVYLAVVTTAIANYIQTKAQKNVTAERASVIYAMDPVYGAIFANLLLGETLSSAWGWMGAALITVAAATNAFLDLSVKKEQ